MWITSFKSPFRNAVNKSTRYKSKLRIAMSASRIPTDLNFTTGANVSEWSTPSTRENPRVTTLDLRRVCRVPSGFCYSFTLFHFVDSFEPLYIGVLGTRNQSPCTILLMGRILGVREYTPIGGIRSTDSAVVRRRVCCNSSQDEGDGRFPSLTRRASLSG